MMMIRSVMSDNCLYTGGGCCNHSPPFILCKEDNHVFLSMLKWVWLGNQGFMITSFLLIEYLKLPVRRRASITCLRLSSSNTALYCVFFRLSSVMRMRTSYQRSIFRATFLRLSPSKASLFFRSEEHTSELQSLRHLV